MKFKQIRSTVLIATGALSTAIFGCPELIPGPESVMEGTWELVPAAAPSERLTGVFLVFDSSGDLAQMKFTFDDRANVTWNNVSGSTALDGNRFYVSATQTGNGLTFEGTLDSTAAPTLVTGSLNANLIFDDVSISVSQGEATLVKQ